MPELESFNLDHTRVRAPYVRVAARYESQAGEPITKYDLRLGQPNRDILPTDAIHTLEHLLAGIVRDRLDGVLDLSPMGCRTGFYLSVLGPPEPERILDVLRDSLEAVGRHEGPVPGASELECGNYRDHSLPAAQEWAARVLERGLNVQETIPIPARSSTQAA